MPDIDGLETARAHPQPCNGRNTPIIFITGYADEMQTARGYELGAVDYILSPVVAPVLRTKVQVFVDLFEAHARWRRSNHGARIARRASATAELRSSSAG